MSVQSAQTETPKTEDVSFLKQLRDELAVQIHLGSTEARAEWEVLEQKWLELEGKVQDVGTTSAKALHDFEAKSAAKVHDVEDASVSTLKGVGEAAELLMGELMVGYRELRRLLPF